MARRQVVGTAQDVGPSQAVSQAIDAHQELSHRNTGAFSVGEIAGICAVSIVEQMVSGFAFEANRQLAELLVLDEPIALTDCQSA